MKAFIQRLYDHMFWADTLLLERLSRAPEEASAFRLFAHLLAAEQVWLARLQGEDSSGLEVWPTLSLEQCVTLASESHRNYQRYLDTLPEERFSLMVSYRNSQGKQFGSSVWDILAHVAMHGSYHRGQIAMSLRQAGHEPVNADFITFTREGMPQALLWQENQLGSVTHDRYCRSDKDDDAENQNDDLEPAFSKENSIDDGNQSG